MRLKIKSISFILLAFLLFGCKKNNDSFMDKRLKQINIDYLDVINNRESLLVNQFPKKKLPIRLSYKNNSSEPFNYIYLFEFNTQKETIDSIISNIQKDNAILIDSSFKAKSIVINTNQLKEKNLNIENNEMYDPRKKNRLVDEFKTYIIDSSYEGMHKYSKGLFL